MRCHICDRVLDEPKWNKDLEAYEPCDPCMVIILDAIGNVIDKPYADEDELPSEWEEVLKRPHEPNDDLA